MHTVTFLSLKNTNKIYQIKFFKLQLLHNQRRIRTDLKPPHYITLLSTITKIQLMLFQPTTKLKMIAPGSVVEPFHFGPAPASQNGGSGSSSSSSSSSSAVVHNLLLKKKFRKISLLNLPGLFYSQKCTSALLCSSST